MTQFSYSFCMAMLHSFWQAALLLLLYTAVDKLVHKHNAPLAKRNILYSTLLVQLLLFALTFSVYYTDTRSTGHFAQLVQTVSTAMGTEGWQALTPWIFGLYLFMIMFRLSRAIFNWYQFRQQYRSGLVKPAVELKLFTELKAYHFGIKRKVKLWLSSSVHTPVTFGFFKPIILLPVSLVNHISTEQAETLILHELTHIRTNDYLLNWFLIVAESIFFFNPCISRICKAIRLEREKNCDVQVMSFAYAPALYAETLLQAERMKQGVPNFQLAAVNSKKHLLERIQFFTNEKVLNQTLRFNIVAPLIGLVLLLLLSTAVLFQTGKVPFPLNTTSDLKYIPFNNYLVADAVETGTPLITTGNNRISIKPVAAKAVQATDAEALPAVKQLVLHPVSTEPETTAPPVTTDVNTGAVSAEVNIAQPVALTENDAARQIIIKEEGSGTASVKVYYLSFENGQWILQPEWAITAQKIVNDSLNVKTDSSAGKNLKRTYPAQQ